MLCFQMILKFNWRQILGEFNHMQIREIFGGVKYETTNDICGHRGRRLRRELS